MRARITLLPIFVCVVFGVGVGCSSNDKSGGSPNPQDTGADVPAPLGDPQCVGQSFGLSRPVAGVSGGVQSVFTLNSSSVLQSPVPTGGSSMLAQWIGGGIELDWLGTVDNGNDVAVIGGTLTFPADDPAPKGAFCVLPGTVWHKTATGGKIDFVVTEGTTCATGPSDAGVDDAAPSDASSPSGVVMKGCIVFSAI